MITDDMSYCHIVNTSCEPQCDSIAVFNFFVEQVRTICNLISKRHIRNLYSTRVYPSRLSYYIRQLTIQETYVRYRDYFTSYATDIYVDNLARK